MEKDKELIDEAVAYAKSVTIEIIKWTSSSEMVSSITDGYKNYFDAFICKGFTREEAIILLSHMNLVGGNSGKK